MKLKEIKRNKIIDGDIIYLKLNKDLNQHYLGNEMDVNLSGEDVILIIDDASERHDGKFYVNGGHDVIITKDDTVYKMGHYSKLLKLI